MTTNRRITTFLFTGISIFVILGCSMFSGSGLRANSIAPDFILTSISGKRIQLSQFRGKPVLINFWATWCQPCLEEMPVIQSRFRHHFPNLVVLAIEDGSSAREINQVRREITTSFLILRGSSEVMRQYGITAYPTSYFVDEEGVIRSIVIGSLSASELDRELEKFNLIR